MIVDNKKRVKWVLLVFVSMFLLVLGSYITTSNIYDLIYCIVCLFLSIKYYITIKSS